MTPDLAHAFAGVALGHVTREYPNKLDHVLAGPEDARGPRDLHPVFYGSFDWHSCVHGYWMLAHLYRRFPGMPCAGAIRTLFDAHLVPERIAGECAYLARPSARGFERPYGWAWLLKLAAELALHDTPEGRGWSAALDPLARVVRRAVHGVPAAGDLPDPRGRPYQYRVRGAVGAGLPGRGLAGAADRHRSAVVRRRMPIARPGNPAATSSSRRR